MRIHLQRRILFLIAAGAALALVGAGCLFLFRKPIPKNPLLGTWRLESIIENGTSAPIYDADREYLGFVVQNGEPLLRRYYAHDTADALAAVEHWKLTTAEGSSTLQYYSYFDDPNASDTYAEAAYQMSVVGNTLTLKTLPSSKGGTSYEKEVYTRVRSAQQEAHFSLARTPAENAALCADITGKTATTTYATNMLLPVSCNVVLGKLGIQAMLTIDMQGNVSVTEDSKAIWSLLSVMNTDVVDVSSGTADVLGPNDGPFLSPRSIRFVDVTYDGYPDIEVLTDAGAYNWTFDYYPYLPSAGRFATSSILEAVNPEIDANARTITSFSKGRGLADIYGQDTFHYENGTYVLVRDEEQDMVDSTSGDPSAGYIHTVSVLKNGHMVQVLREHLSESQVLGE